MLEVMVHTETPYEESWDVLADSDKAVELEGSKKVLSIIILPNFEIFTELLNWYWLKSLIVDLGKEPH